MSNKGKFDGEEDDLKKCLELLDNHKGLSKEFVDQLKSNPAQMRLFMDLTAKINREPYKPSQVSNASPNMAVSPLPLSKDMIGRINNEFYSSSGVSMTQSSPAGTVNRSPADMFIANYGNPLSQSNPYPIHSYSSTGYGALAILVILLVVIGIVIYAVVLLLRFLF